MTEKDILDAWAHIRRVDSKTPDEVLDFMKDAAIGMLRAARPMPHYPSGRPEYTWHPERGSQIVQHPKRHTRDHLTTCDIVGHRISEFDPSYCIRCGYIKEPGQ